MAWYSNWFTHYGAYTDTDDKMKKVGFYSTHKGRRYVTAVGMRSDHVEALVVEARFGKGDSPEKSAALDAVCDSVIETEAPQSESRPDLTVAA